MLNEASHGTRTNCTIQTLLRKLLPPQACDELHDQLNYSNASILFDRNTGVKVPFASTYVHNLLFSFTEI